MKTRKRASIRQVAATIFFALFAIGKKNTWQKDEDGATVTLPQIIIGALVGFALLLAILIGLVTLATS
jgi:hypothetical protein